MSNVSSSSSSSGGIGFCGLLTVLFVALKLTGYIDWSWWWVLSPLWGAIVFAVVVVLGCVGTAVVIEYRRDQRLIEQRRKRSGL